MIPRVVLDTNVVVSALLKPGSLEDQVLRLGFGGQVAALPVRRNFGRVCTRACPGPSLSFDPMK
jgi:hypothetical protein